MRSADWALVTQYEILKGRGAEEYWLGPSIKEVRIVDGKIQLAMSTIIKTRDDSDGCRASSIGACAEKILRFRLTAGAPLL